jgi:hypothetical protein
MIAKRDMLEITENHAVTRGMISVARKSGPVVNTFIDAYKHVTEATKVSVSAVAS